MMDISYVKFNCYKAASLDDAQTYALDVKYTCSTYDEHMMNIWKLKLKLKLKLVLGLG